MKSTPPGVQPCGVFSLFAGINIYHCKFKLYGMPSTVASNQNISLTHQRKPIESLMKKKLFWMLFFLLPGRGKSIHHSLMFSVESNHGNKLLKATSQHGALSNEEQQPRINLPQPGSGPMIPHHSTPTFFCMKHCFLAAILLFFFTEYAHSQAGPDTDGDGMSDAYETSNGLLVNVDDRFGDVDNDGIPNLVEYLKGTLAGNASSVPSADRIVGVGQSYTTIASALSSLTADDMIIVVKPGTYVETLTNATRRVYLIAESRDPYSTIIKGATSAAHTITSNKDIYLRGFTISGNGAASLQISGGCRCAAVQCVFRDCTFGVYSNFTTGTAYLDLYNSMIQGGTSGGISTNGAGILNLKLNYCTLSGNAAAATSGTGKGVKITNGSINATNSIFWDGGTSELAVPSVVVTYSCVRGTSVTPGAGNINSNPQLLQGFLATNSPCINSAQVSTPANPVDIRGQARPSGSNPDMGAHEYRTDGVWATDYDGDGVTDFNEVYVNGTRFDLNDSDGDGMSDPYEIAQGLMPTAEDRFADLDNDRFPNLAEFVKVTQANNSASVPSPDRVVGSGQTYTTITSAINSLTADDQIILVKPGVYNEVINSTSRRVFIIAESADPCSTVISGGTGTLPSVTTNKDLYLRGLKFTGSQAKGIYITGACRVAAVQCIIQNHSYAAYTYFSSGTANLEMTNCLVQGGTSGGVFAAYATLNAKLVHCTIWGNCPGSTTTIRTGVYVASGSIEMNNCISWNVGLSEISVTSGTVSVTNSCVRGSSVMPGGGNINADPLISQGFLRASSPCINTAQATSPATLFDLRGQLRPSGSNPDMGAHEYRTDGIWLGDFDGDGISDFAEIYTYGTNFLVADTDGDGMPDGYETAQGLDPFSDDRSLDVDGDGVPNIIEYSHGTLANNPSSYPSPDRIVGLGQTYLTIASAISSLSDDDQIILVKPGLYNETLSNTARRVCIRAESNDPAQTVIRSASKNDPAITTNKDLYLRGFTIAGYNSPCIQITGVCRVSGAQCVLCNHTYAVYNYFNSGTATLDLANCLIQGGSSGGICAVYAALNVKAVHCSIIDNATIGSFSTAAGRGVYLTVGTSSLSNCVLWNGGTSEVYVGTGANTATYSCVRGSPVMSGIGNTNADPMLMGASLSPASPCLDSALAVSGLQSDLRGLPRVSGVAADMGCIELQSLGRPDLATSAFEAFLGLSAGVGSLDSDGDGISDLVEWQQGTDPWLSDTDGDGIIDALDLYPLDPNNSSVGSGSGDFTPPAITVTSPIGAVKLP